eukprot:COSAG02_NODE_1715_length_11211_cov_8.483801_11_plen_122_part_00
MVAAGECWLDDTGISIALVIYARRSGVLSLLSLRFILTYSFLLPATRIPRYYHLHWYISSTAPVLTAAHTSSWRASMPCSTHWSFQSEAAARGILRCRHRRCTASIGTTSYLRHPALSTPA